MPGASVHQSYSWYQSYVAVQPPVVITARIRRMGKVMFSVCPHLGGGQVSPAGGGGSGQSSRWGGGGGSVQPAGGVSILSPLAGGMPLAFTQEDFLGTNNSAVHHPMIESLIMKIVLLFHKVMRLKIDVCGASTGLTGWNISVLSRFELYKVPRNLWKPHSYEHGEHLAFAINLYCISASEIVSLTFDDRVFISIP